MVTSSDKNVDINKTNNNGDINNSNNIDNN